MDLSLIPASSPFTFRISDSMPSLLPLLSLLTLAVTLATAGHCESSTPNGEYCSANKIHYICMHGKDAVSEVCACGCTTDRCTALPPCPETTAQTPPLSSPPSDATAPTRRTTILQFLLVAGIVVVGVVAVIYLTIRPPRGYGDKPGDYEAAILEAMGMKRVPWAKAKDLTKDTPVTPPAVADTTD